MTDVGFQNEPLSLIVIPPATAEDGALSAAVTSQSPLALPSLNSSSNISTNTPSAYKARSATMDTDSPSAAPLHSEPKSQSDMVEIRITKADDDALAQGDAGEASSDTVAGSSDPSTTSAEDNQEWTDNDNELKRVKVYELVGSRWMDQGTAFCFGHFTPDGTEAVLTARSEKDYQNVILTTTIRSTDVYQRQQETLIVWTEPDGADYALSFQDPEGCAEVWNFILEVQKHMNGNNGQQDPSSTPPTPGRSTQLPVPQISTLATVERLIKGLSRTHAVKERVCEYIVQEEYIKQMISVLEMAEDLEDLGSLHSLCSLMQTILMLNDHTMYEHVVDDDLFLGVVGMLEYDPEFPTHKANYRDFLQQNSQFHQPIPFRDAAIQRKIHHTYRLQFLKDVVLARALDDSTFTVLNACIIFNQTDIINHVQQDPSFLRDVVRLYVDDDMLNGGGRKSGPATQGVTEKDDEPVIGPHPAPTEEASTNGTSEHLSSTPEPSLKLSSIPGWDELSDEQVALRREVILLLQQLCAMGKSVQLTARIALFRSLVDRGVLFAVQWALASSEQHTTAKSMINAGGEILSAVLDHDLNGARSHVLKQVVAIDKEREAGKKGADKAETLAQTVCRIMSSSKDLAIQSLVGESLKSWLDLPGGEAGPSAAGLEAHGALGAANKFLPRKDEPGTERFLDYFYNQCADTLFKPINEIHEWKTFTEPTLPLTREETNRFVYLCDLLYNFTLQHHFRSHSFIISSKIVTRLATLLKARDKHLRHAAFRIFRLFLRQRNANLQTQVLKMEILKPILDLTIQESRRDNLLSCSCQEYFEQIRRENMKDVIKHCMSKYESEIKTLAQSPLGGHRFQLFIRRWEMNNEPIPMDSQPENTNDARGWPVQSRVLDAEEEDYFNADDDDDDFVPSISQLWSRGTGASSPIPMNPLKRKRRLVVSSAPRSFRLQHKSPVLDQLSDYGEEDEDEVKPNGERSVPISSTKKAQPKAGSSRPDSPLSPSSSKRELAATDELATLLDEYEGLSDDDDAALQKRKAEPVPTPQPRPKRARGDDDDDELLERLTKSKKPDLGTEKETGIVRGRTKPGDDPPRKFKMKIGKSLAAAVTTGKGNDGDAG
ncbi:component of IIS longevity pathway SMK-1-domain-containing protein [Mycena floridula]|nr:component of IIS longevity pathway SMK-1-domain-containing protein [Mycena floridula]